MTTLELLYLILLIGSIAFGLEALLIALGGRLMLLYRRRRAKTLGLALVVGFGIVGAAVITSAILAPEPLYVCALVLIYMFVVGKVVSLFKTRLIKPSPPPLPRQPSEREIKEMLRKRGYGKLVRKKRKR